MFYEKNNNNKIGICIRRSDKKAKFESKVIVI